MIYRVRLTRKARKAFQAADLALARKIVRCFEVLEQTPRHHPNIKALKGEMAGRYRYRVGDYRVVYRVEDEMAEVIVLIVQHRRDVYG
jgi:mRNA interferase RelE/StbE